MKNVIEPGYTNIKWFRKEYPAEIWREQIKKAKTDAYNNARKIFAQKSDWKGIEDEMKRVCSAREANAAYYGLSPQGLEDLKQKQQDILEALKMSKVVLDSAAFVWMIKNED